MDPFRTARADVDPHLDLPRPIAVVPEASPTAEDVADVPFVGFDGEAWVIRIRCQREFARFAVEALELSARARDANHPTAGIFFRLAGAFREAMTKEQHER